MDKNIIFLNKLTFGMVELSTRVVEGRHQYAIFIPGGEGIKRLRPGVV